MSTPRPVPATGGDIFIAGFTLLFIGLKLGHVIDWSWWWVASPYLILLGLLGLLVVIVAVIEGRK